MATDNSGGTPARAIACVGLSADTENALHSIVNVLAGRTRCGWQFTSPERASVLVVGYAGGRPRIAPRAPASCRLVAVANVDDPKPAGRFTLTHPFRVMPVMSLLDELDEDMGGTEPAAAGATSRAANTPFPAARATPTPPSAARASSSTPFPSRDPLAVLREIARTPAAPGAFFVATAGIGERVWFSHDGSQCASTDETLAKLAAGTVTLAAPYPAQSLPPATAKWRPSMAVRWHCGWHQHARAIVSATERFSLRAWPDFGALAAARWQLQAAAQLTRAPMTLDDLARRTAHDRDALAGFIAACDALELIERHAPVAAPVVAAPPREGVGSFMSALIDGLRVRLGFERAR